MVHPDDEDVSKAVSNLRRQVETFRFKLEATLPPGKQDLAAKFALGVSKQPYPGNAL